MVQTSKKTMICYFYIAFNDTEFLIQIDICKKYECNHMEITPPEEEADKRGLRWCK